MEQGNVVIYVFLKVVKPKKLELQFFIKFYDLFDFDEIWNVACLSTDTRFNKYIYSLKYKISYIR